MGWTGSKVNDEYYIERAIELASKGLGHTRPNPAVGAVIVKDGVIIGEGWHKKAGGDHAEVAAIKNAHKKGDKTSASLEGASIYVTLEPCSKVGRVGACTDAIASAGISRVVYVVSDPNPKNRGKAKRVLAKRGIECVQYKGDKLLIAKCQDLIKGFSKHILTGMPYVTVKIAMSLDGKICDDWGNANWISSTANAPLSPSSEFFFCCSQSLPQQSPFFFWFCIRFFLSPHVTICRPQYAIYKLR